jgi:long-chain acyl-CoA synthetase
MNNNVGLEHFAQTTPERTAVISGNDRWSFAELNAQANRFAQALRHAGLNAGDTFAIIAPNCPEYLIAYFGAMRAGLFIVAVNWHLSREELAYLLADSQTAAVLVHVRHARTLEDALVQAGRSLVLRIALPAREGYTSWNDFLATGAPTGFATSLLGRTLLYTSATTGRPKAIETELTDSARARERTLRLHAGFNASAGIEVGSGATHLCTSMLYHPTPLECAAVAIELGHPVVLMERWEPEEALRLIELYQVQTTMMVPSMFVRLLKLPRATRERYSVSSLRFVSHGCAPCPMEVKRDLLAWWGPIIWEAYGSSEASGTIVSPEEWLRYPGTVGRPYATSAVRILDSEGRDMPAGEAGLVYLRRFTGDRFAYRGEPEKTRAAWRGEFCTAGDIGYVNEEGYLFLCDRACDVIICGGKNVYSAELERVLILHPQVADCAVFGVPHALLGEVAHAVVEPIAGSNAGPELRRQLKSFLAERLSLEKLPRQIEFIDRLPRDPNGKLFKRHLRERYQPSSG